MGKAGQTPDPVTAPRIYLDHAGATPVPPDLDQELASLAGTNWANPSSPHAEGRTALALMDQARDRLAQVLKVVNSELVFTSSGTEAVNLAIGGAAAKGARLTGRHHLITWQAEHQSVLESHRRLELAGFEVTYLPVDGQCRVDLDQLQATLRQDTALVSIGLSNNEVGTVHPTTEIAELVHQCGPALVFVDACQGPAWMEFSPSDSGADLASFSGHKSYGPPGSGALWLRSGVSIDPLVVGGPQERGRRAGNLNPAACWGLALGLEYGRCQRTEQADRLRRMRSWLTGRLCDRLPNISISGALENRLVNHISLVVDGILGEDMLIALDLRGLAASSGSACASGSLDPSHVLLAMGYSLEQARQSLRLTLGYDTTWQQVETAADTIAEVLGGLATVGTSAAGLRR